jgi:hypothetical protein
MTGISLPEPRCRTFQTSRVLHSLAVNLQTGSGWRFAKAYAADYRVGRMVRLNMSSIGWAAQNRQSSVRRSAGSDDMASEKIGQESGLDNDEGDDKDFPGRWTPRFRR